MMEKLEEALGYNFRNGDLLTEALTHSIDYSNNGGGAGGGTTTITHGPKRTYDRLKIIGDCVIKLLTCQYAISVSKPETKLGAIAKVKDDLCTRQRQNEIGHLLRLEKYIGVTKELQNNPGFCIGNQYDTFVKSLLGAVFIDAGGSHRKGFISCWKVFLRLWKDALKNYDAVKPLIACFPEPQMSSRQYLQEKYKDLKMRDLALLEEKIGFVFSKKPYLLEQALTHDSITQDGVGNKTDFVHYQCLEFLGDSVLELVIMEYLYFKYTSDDPLGQMLFFNRDTGQKLYSAKFQKKVAMKLQLDLFVIKAPNVTVGSYDDFVESLIGAVYVHSGLVGLKKTAQIVLSLWDLQPLDFSFIDDEPNQPKAAVAVPVPPLVSIPEENPMLLELQAKLGYKFKDNRMLKEVLELDGVTSPANAVQESSENDSSNTYPPFFRNLEILGKRIIDLLLVEYVLGICPATKANLSSSVKKSLENLRALLISPNVMNEIGRKFELQKYVFIIVNRTNGCEGTSDSEKYIFAIVAAIYIDSGGDYTKVLNVFNKLWHSYIKSEPKRGITKCFPCTSEEQQKFRAHCRCLISEEMWKRLNKKMGYTFQNKNLFEQALTDEKSQPYAKEHLKLCPTGNPFGLRLLGKSVIDLFIAHRSFHNAASSPENFSGLVDRFDQSLFKVFQNTYPELERCYVRYHKYPYPPTKNPRAPFEALLGAVYIDSGGGNGGCESVEKVIRKPCPTLLLMSKVKGGVKATPSESCATPPPTTQNLSPPPVSTPPASKVTVTPVSTLPASKVILPPVSTPPATKFVPPPAQTPPPRPSASALGSVLCSTPNSVSPKCAANFGISPEPILVTSPRKRKASTTESSASSTAGRSTPVIKEGPTPKSFAAVVKTEKPKNPPPPGEISPAVKVNGLVMAVVDAQSKIKALKKEQHFSQQAPPPATNKGSKKRAARGGKKNKKTPTEVAGLTAAALPPLPHQTVKAATPANSVPLPVVQQQQSVKVIKPTTSVPLPTIPKQQSSKVKPTAAVATVVPKPTQSTLQPALPQQQQPTKVKATACATVPKTSQPLPTLVRPTDNPGNNTATSLEIPVTKSPAEAAIASPSKKSKRQKKKQESLEATHSEDVVVAAQIPAQVQQSATVTVPINMVHGYPNEKLRHAATDFKKGGESNPQPGCSKNGKADEDKKGTHAKGISLVGVIKWTAVVLGVLYLVKRYNRK